MDFQLLANPSQVQMPVDELPVIIRLFEHNIELNKDYTHLRSNQTRAYRRAPAPQILPVAEYQVDLDGKLNFYAAWEAVLLMFPECLDYDGSRDSELAFGYATGLSPCDFIRAWMESSGSQWQYFHAKPPKTAGGIVVGLSKAWVIKTARWRRQSYAEALATHQATYPFKDFDRFVRETRVEMEKVMFGGDGNRALRRVLFDFEVTDWPDCHEHPENPLCRCRHAGNVPIEREVAVKMEQLVGPFAAFVEGNDPLMIFVGGEESGEAYARWSEGHTVEEVAFVFLVSRAEEGGEPTRVDIPGLVQLWAELVSGWRSEVA